jgi:hypothetical protein
MMTFPGIKLDPVVGCVVFLIDHLAAGHLVQVIFSPAVHADVVVPKHLRDADVMFNYGLKLPMPIPDLEITRVGIRATLSFNRVEHATFVPWESVVLISTSITTEKGDTMIGVPGPCGIARGVVEAEDAPAQKSVSPLRLVKGGAA